MYFIIKYNVFDKYITTTEINTCKKIFEFGQREVISFFTLELLTRESTLLFTQSKQTLTGREPEKRIKHHERCTLVSRI
jgi:hypothetical protein